MGRSGEAITFVTPEEAPKWRQIERVLGKSLPRRPWGEDGSPVSVDAAAAGTEETVSIEASAPAERPSDQAPRRPRWRSRSGPYGQRPAR
jgi:superfamily II DNA/RNA helicase